MEWRSACRLSAINDAHRLATERGIPYRARRYGDGSHVVDCEGTPLLESDADRFYDWEPIERVDPITALGKVVDQKPKPLKAPGPTPFDSYLGGLGW